MLIHLVIAGGIVAATAALSAALIVMLRPLMVRYALARPNARSSHRVPTPQGGGAAVVAATVAVAALCLLAWPGGLVGANGLAAVFGATILLALVGAVDDIRALPASLRLLLHAIGVGAMLAALPETLRVLPFLPFGLERALLLLAGIWIVNLVNFMDGLDWMTVAEFVPLLGGLALVLAIQQGLSAPVAVALALLGAILGFAPFNRPVARLFLGDVGSLPLGLLLAWLLALVAGGGNAAAAIILPLYYFADATLTLGRRLLRREKVWEAHRTHFYQRATDLGHGVTAIVRMVFLANLGLVGLALISALWPAWPVAVATVAGAMATVGLLLRRLSRPAGGLR